MNFKSQFNTKSTRPTAPPRDSNKNISVELFPFRCVFFLRFWMVESNEDDEETKRAEKLQQNHEIDEEKKYSGKEDLH